MRINNKETLVSFNNKYNRLFDEEPLNYCSFCFRCYELGHKSSECHYSFRELAIMEENGIIEKNKGNKNRNFKNNKRNFKNKKIINCINNKENNNNNYSSNVVNKLGKDNYNIHDNENKNNLYNERMLVAIQILNLIIVIKIIYLKWKKI
ncbi:hypothetical protein LY90DRAFT_518406 [Neocallimastix californiae]|uniref:CCHC-type domain-containing protein n=1 Tax=Neocallimastix californiae TaxID=1754190 RepID=A0A1Y1ZPZ7_9FUNG|nr:hypothetical protein LY90DRAFT_518406 [Neocallimastix californiae]|eukprot:ORY12067.1 hypothetical protein LY90DRAFT_518406 [Neocallimastix californiae]